MKATITIEDNLLRDLVRMQGDPDSSEAIRSALREYVTWRKWEGLLTFGHRFEWENDVLPKMDLTHLRSFFASCRGMDFQEKLRELLREYSSRRKIESILTLGHRFEWEEDVLPRIDIRKLRNLSRRPLGTNGEEL